MLPAGLGWSASDLVCAIKVIWQIVDAFDQAKGAKKQYLDSRAFLVALIPILNRIQQLLEDDNDNLQDEMSKQAGTIIQAYAEFDHYLDKRHGLSSRNSSNIRSVIATIKWALDDLHEKVQKLKGKVLDAMAIMEKLIVLDIRDQVRRLVDSMHVAGVENQQYQEALNQTADILADIRSHISSLEEVSKDYRSKLEDISSNHTGQASDVEKISIKLGEIESSQKELKATLHDLNKHILEQGQDTTSADEAAHWQRLKAEAESQNSALEDLQASQKKTEEDLKNTWNLIDGTANVTGNAQIKDTANRFGGGIQIFGALSPFAGSVFGKMGGQKSSETNTQSSPPSSAYRQRIDYMDQVRQRRDQDRIDHDPQFKAQPPPRHFSLLSKGASQPKMSHQTGKDLTGSPPAMLPPALPLRSSSRVAVQKKSPPPPPPSSLPFLQPPPPPGVVRPLMPLNRPRSKISTRSISDSSSLRSSGYGSRTTSPDSPAISRCSSNITNASLPPLPSPSPSQKVSGSLGSTSHFPNDRPTSEDSPPALPTRPAPTSLSLAVLSPTLPPSLPLRLPLRRPRVQPRLPRPISKAVVSDDIQPASSDPSALSFSAKLALLNARFTAPKRNGLVV